MTANLVLLICAFLVLALLPMLPALFDVWQADTSAFLEIPADRNDDPRHFSRRLKDVIRKGEMNDTHIVRVEEGAEASTLLKSSLHAYPSSLLSRLPWHKPAKTETRIALLQAGASISAPITWLGDALAKTEIVLQSQTVLRTLRCEGHCLMQPNVSVLRWLDARSLYVMGPNRLPQRTTAKHSMSLSTGVRFQRLHAPIITTQKTGESVLPPAQSVGMPPLPPEVEIWRLEADDETLSGHKLFTDDVYLCADSAVNCDVVCQGDLHVGERALIKGNLKIKGDLFLHAASRIIGHVQCHGSITLDQGCEVDGVMSCLAHLSIASACTLGTASAQTSLIADTITLHAGVSIHGHVWARHSGLTDA